MITRDLGGFKSSERLIIRTPHTPFLPDLHELWDHRSMAAIIIWRDLKVRFSHTALGVAWYVLQPCLLMLVITLGFRFALPGDVSGLPYPLFVASGLVLWQYFANAFSAGASSFERFHGIINKVYMPRLVLPLACVIASLADLGAASLLLVPLSLYYRVIPSWRLVLVPCVLLGVMIFVAGLALWLSIACTKYKDLRHVVPFASQVFFFSAPIFFPHTVLPGGVQILFGINPLAGYVDTFRWLLFPNAHRPRPAMLGLALGLSAAIFVIGLLYFQRHQAEVVDII